MSNTMDRDKIMLDETEVLRRDYQRISEKPTFGVNKPLELMLPMSDGIRLSTVIQTPKGEPPFSTILTRTCYPDTEFRQQIHAEEYCKRGFAYVYQFCRGTGRSEGIWEPNVNERNDGKITIDWLNNCPWVLNIGYFGSSYLAFTGWIIADILPAKVKTLYLSHYGTDRFTSVYQNGLFRQGILTAWAMRNAGFTIDADYPASAAFRPQIQVDEAMWGQKLQWYRDWITNTNREDPYWQTGLWYLLSNIPSQVKIPVSIVEGWYDHHLGSALHTWMALSPQCKKHSQLRIGAWNHSFQPCIPGNNKNLQNSNVIHAFDWFDSILRKGQLPDQKVSLYQIGADQWNELESIPETSAKEQSYYLSTRGDSQNIATLSTHLDSNQSALTYCYDPENPVNSHGAEAMMRPMEEVGSLPQPPCGYRDDVISFISSTLEQGMDIIGKIRVELYVASDAEDTAFTAKVMEVFSDGTAFNIRSSITTLAYPANSVKDRVIYTPDSIVRIVIEMWDNNWHIQKGSRLRLDISSSDFPQSAVHSNYPGIWALQDKCKKAIQKIYCGCGYPSRLVLPIL